MISDYFTSSEVCTYRAVRVPSPCHTWSYWHWELLEQIECGLDLTIYVRLDRKKGVRAGGRGVSRPYWFDREELSRRPQAR